MIVAIVATVAIWGVLSLYDVTSEIGKALLASSAVLALFAGLAFSTPLSNLGSGLLVAFTQPLRLGDRVSVAGETGFVEEMNLIYTTLVTDDARRIFIPNTPADDQRDRQSHDQGPSPARFRARSPSRSRRRSTRHEWCSTTRSPRCRAPTPGTRGSGSERSASGPSGSTLRPMPRSTPTSSTLASELRERGLLALRDAGFLAG